MKNNQNISREHLLYLRGIKRKTITVNVLRIAILFLFILTEMKRKENEETFQITFKSGRISV